MLVNHSDTGSDCATRRSKMNNIAVDSDLPGVGLDHTECDSHQRALTGPILSE